MLTSSHVSIALSVVAIGLALYVYRASMIRISDLEDPPRAAEATPAENSTEENVDIDVNAECEQKPSPSPSS